MHRNASAYDADFYAWTQDQAAALRRAAEARVNLDLDFANLAEEIESMGRSDWKAVQHALMRVIEHLLKLEFSPARDPRADWRGSVALHRIHASEDLEASPSLRARIDLPRAWRQGRRLAALSLAAHDGIDERLLPAECPYTLEQVLDEDWWPASRHGLD